MIEIYLLMSTIYSTPYGQSDILSSVVLEIEHKLFLVIVECYTHILNISFAKIGIIFELTDKVPK